MSDDILLDIPEGIFPDISVEVLLFISELLFELSFCLFCIIDTKFGFVVDFDTSGGTPPFKLSGLDLILYTSFPCVSFVCCKNNTGQLIPTDFCQFRNSV